MKRRTIFPTLWASKWQSVAAATLFVCCTSALSQTQTVGVFTRLPGAFDGYTLFTPRQWTETFLVDMTGQLVNRWSSSVRVENGKLLENGLLLRTANIMDSDFSNIPGAHGRLELVDWDGTVVWTYDNDDLQADPLSTKTTGLHHDVVPLPNGNFLASTYEVFTPAEAMTQGRIADSWPVNDQRLLAERVVEIQPNTNGSAYADGGTIVWQWRVWDHLSQDVDNTSSNYVANLSDAPGRINLNYYRKSSPTSPRPRFSDWNHVSGLDYNASLNQVLLTFHGHDELFIIDHSTTTAEAAANSGGDRGKGGELLYRTGNPQTYGVGGAAQKRYTIIHNGHWIPAGLNDAGKIMVLNNNARGTYSILEMLTIPTDVNGNYTIPSAINDPANAVLEVVWDDGFKSTNMGGGQRLPNGNTLCDDAVHGRFLEITPAKEIVWEYVNPVADEGPLEQGTTIPENPRSGDQLNECFRATRLAADYPGFIGQTLDPTTVLETPPAGSPSPAMSIGSQGDITASWPVVGSEGWFLETSVDLQDWVRMDASVEVGSGIKLLNIDTDDLPQQFFRLQKYLP